MIDKAPPPPPVIEQPAKPGQRTKVPIVDMREQFKRRTAQTTADRARARAFIEGKIEMVRRDPNLTNAEKAAAISELKAKR